MAAELFHGFIAVAPLKQDFRDLDGPVLDPLPRLHRRGPIEATGLWLASRPWLRLFHGFIAVAPLKLYFIPHSSERSSPLPRLHRRGPIEAINWYADAIAMAGSSTASSPWPH